MLIRRGENGVLVIGQASHAWISGQLARAWGNDRFPAPTPREEVCLAAAQHDVGWVEWDLHPTLDADRGHPHSFLDMPELATHIELWRAAPEKLLTQSSYAALLVSMHGTALYARRDLDALAPDDASLVRDYLSSERARQEELKALLAPDERELTRNQRLIWTWDSLSLAACLPWDPHTATRVPAADGEVDIHMQSTGSDRFALHPWPFATSEVEVHCEARQLAGGFRDEAEMQAALDHAPLRRLRFSLADVNR